MSCSMLSPKSRPQQIGLAIGIETPRIARDDPGSDSQQPLTYTMPSAPLDQSSPEAKLLRAAYAAFNSRDIVTAASLMTPDVTWPRAFKGGFVRGPQEVGDYWKEQWSEIDPKVEPLAFYPDQDGRILVEVHQVVRDLAGTVLADERVGHRFTLEGGLIQGMEVCALPLAPAV
jgi:hypothetical protein